MSELRRLNTAEERISELEDRLKENQIEEQRNKRLKKTDAITCEAVSSNITNIVEY